MTDRTPPKAVLDDLKRSAALQDMMVMPGWKVYVELLEFHMNQKQRDALQPAQALVGLDGLTQVLVGEAAKGAIIGIQFALALPATIIAGADTVRKQYSPSTTEVSGS